MAENRSSITPKKVILVTLCILVVTLITAFAAYTFRSVSQHPLEALYNSESNIKTYDLSSMNEYGSDGLGYFYAEKEYKRVDDITSLDYKIYQNDDGDYVLLANMKKDSSIVLEDIDTDGINVDDIVNGFPEMTSLNITLVKQLYKIGFNIEKISLNGMDGLLASSSSSLEDGTSHLFTNLLDQLKIDYSDKSFSYFVSPEGHLIAVCGSGTEQVDIITNFFSVKEN